MSGLIATTSSLNDSYYLTDTKVYYRPIAPTAGPLCRCDNSADQCPRPMTQEDLLCDPCRDHCLTIKDGSGHWHFLGTSETLLGNFEENQ